MALALAQPFHLATAVQTAIATETHTNLILRLAAVLLLLHGGSAPAMNIPIHVICGLLLLFPALLRQTLLWWTLVMALVLGNGTDWSFVDNHKYLITYWTLACAISLHLREPDEYLRTTARLLVAVAFGFAVIWKLIGGEYLNGAFWYWTFLMDPRIQKVGAVLASRTADEVAIASQAIRFLGTTGAEAMALPALSSPALWNVTVIMSWLVLFGEACLSVSHFSGSSRLYRLRHVFLIGFIVLTYFLLPVVGFAFVLTLLGFAQCRQEDLWLSRVYLALLALVQFTVLPWQTLLNAGATG